MSKYQYQVWSDKVKAFEDDPSPDPDAVQDLWKEFRKLCDHSPEYHGRRRDREMQRVVQCAVNEMGNWYLYWDIRGRIKKLMRQEAAC